ncbi:hypothetical protein FA15DRAFT_597404 [Coprinopsis marcescibilis]|uniref:Bromo domain-containing protein n=1 Tax=Coprinopsis marcescibilis TaxID=230819 RepID=A0A5C3KN40_COPMA|nr:hypothetical protein FA15DRAFT_597404 [Coprinopsis marcescibilis]
MDYTDFPSSFDVDSPRSINLKPSGSTSSGLRLVLPPLKSILAAKGNKKPSTKKHSGSTSFAQSPIVQDVELVEKRAPRPVKLKPLKEVLSKLIYQIKKKDDYAFFLTPVDAKNVPGYLDVVTTPMDFGTMSDKVNRGRYRSLDEFATDFRLVTTNAKIFNPPGSIYHHEAERIESWGIEHISKAAGTVIQYEADWNIDIEKEDDAPTTVNVEDEDDGDRAGSVDGDVEQSQTRAGSVTSQQPTSGRRGPRGPYKKQTQSNNTLAESMEPDGRLPGSKDGLGSFPSGSDWANTMLHLKLKGKRYKTKKERMRIEKEGPPMLPDGSLDYTEMEDPFSVLSFFVPDPPMRPSLIPLYPPLFSVSTPLQSQDTVQTHPQPPPQDHNRQSVPPSQPEQDPPQEYLFPAPTNIPSSHNFPDIPLLAQSTSYRASSSITRSHWNISRNLTRRGKDKDDETEMSEFPSWQTPRDAHPADFGSFASLAGELAEEMQRRGLTPRVAQPGEEQQANFDIIRESVSCNMAPREEEEEGAKKVRDAAPPSEQEDIIKNYWTKHRAIEAESYIRDLVYGGEDGLAYVRSLAAFMDYGSSEDHMEEDAPEETKPVSQEETNLGMPLATWVEKNVVDLLTGGRHSLIREAAQVLHSKNCKNFEGQGLSNGLDIVKPGVLQQVAKSLNLYPLANAALAALISINMHKIDMGALIKTPQELFLSEEEWYGKDLKERHRKKKGAATVKDEDAMDVEDGTLLTPQQQEADYELEGPEELKEVLDYSAAVILDLNRRRSTTKSEQVSPTALVETVSADRDPEDPVMRNLRLNLLALAKRAPLDTIARLPKDLVPEHIRQYVPTLGST